MPFKPIHTKVTKIGKAVTAAIDPVAIEAGIQDRKSALLASVNPDPIPGLNAKLAGYKIVACGEAGTDTSAHRAKLADMITTANGGDGEMFALPTYVRYLYKYGSRMSPAEALAIKNALIAQTHELYGHGTLNHAAMQCTSYYLLAQYYPDVIWTDNSAGTWTSAQVMATNKANMLLRIARFTANAGHAEVTGSTYSIVNLMCAINMVDFCLDAELKAAMQKEAVIEVAVLRANSFHGNIVAPILRRNYEQLNAPDSPQTYTPSVGQHILWFYYGEPNTSAYDLSGDKEPNFAAMLACSDWRPPLVTYKQAPGDVFLNIPTFSQWAGATYTQLVARNYITDDFAIGCSNAIFDPAGYTAWQTFSINFKSNAPQNQISCYHPYFDSNSGEDAWTTNRWSPFQQMYRYDDSSVIMLFSIPTADPWQYDGSNSYWMTRNNQAAALFQLAQYRIPKSVDELDTSDASGKWVFARAGSTMIAVGTLNGTNEYPSVPALDAKYTVVKIRQAKTALFWRVESGSDFAEFKVRSKAAAPSFTASANPSCAFTTKDGHYTTVTFNVAYDATVSAWACCPVVVKSGLTQSRENSNGFVSDTLNAGKGRLSLASVGLTYSY